MDNVIMSQYVGFEVLTAMVMKSSVFWVIMPWRMLEVNQCQGNMLPPSSQPRNKTSSACYFVHASFLLGLFSGPEDGGRSSVETSCDFQLLHGIISQKTELFTLKCFTDTCNMTVNHSRLTGMKFSIKATILVTWKLKTERMLYSVQQACQVLIRDAKQMQHFTTEHLKEMKLLKQQVKVS
jgi:hypothetical protein